MHQSFGITRSFNIFIFKRVAFFGTLNVFPHVVVPIVGLENPTEFHRKKPSIPACRGWRTGSFHHGYPVFITKSQKFSSPIHMDLRPYSTIGQQKLCGFFFIPLASLNRSVSKVVDADEKCSSSAAVQRSAVFEFASEVAGDITEAWWKLVVVKGLQLCWRCDCYDGDWCLVVPEKPKALTGSSDVVAATSNSCIYVWSLVDRASWIGN